jgi:hypothetical protein
MKLFVDLLQRSIEPPPIEKEKLCDIRMEVSEKKEEKEESLI